MNKEKLLEIIAKYLNGSASEAEKKAVDDWYESADAKTIGIPSPVASRLEEIREQSYNQILAETNPETPVISFYRKAGIRAAAAIVLIAGVALYFAYEFKTRSAISSETPAPVLVKNDVSAPSVNRATLKLSDGSEIEIDSIANGKLAVQGNVTIIKKSNGIIAYEGNGSQTSFNTLTVPRGSRPQRLELADGSVVWLNVASSVTYPVSFTDKERKVEITGEAYFEIAKDITRPFIVKKSNDLTDIKVLGTHFNVNAYDDEGLMRVTLLEGSVQVNGPGKTRLLVPGQQAQVKMETLSVTNSVDLDQVMAWKDGRFLFDGADINTIMRQIGKWYDVEVVFESENTEKLVANISRDVNVSELLEIFEKTDLIHFDIEGKKIIVKK